MGQNATAVKYRPLNDEAWLKLSSHLNSFVQFISSRNDILVYASPEVDFNGKPHQASAYFLDTKASIFIDAAKFISPEDNPADIDPYDASDRIKFIDLIGACSHEGAHAAHTEPFEINTVNFKAFREASNAVREWFQLLEESRVEKRLIERRQAERSMIKGALGSLIPNVVMDGVMENPTDKLANVRFGLLVNARVDAGTLDAVIFSKVTDGVKDVLGEDLYGALAGLWAEAHEIEDGDFYGMLDIAERFQKALEDNNVAPDEDGEAISLSCAGGFGGDGEGQGQGQEQGQEQGQGQENGRETAFGKALAASSEQAQTDIVEDSKGDEVLTPWEHMRRERAKADAERAKNQREQDAADRNAEAKTSGGGYSYDRFRVQIKHRAVNANDRAYARAITAHLRKAQHRDIARTKIKTELPPGRVRAGELMRRDSQIAQSQTITATPWTRISRRVVEQPPINLGISFDVSGSLSSWTDSVSSFTWGITQALKSVKGRVASVAWDTDIYTIVKPGTFPNTVPAILNGGGTSAQERSMRALDGMLDLTNGEGVRMAVMLTDGDFSGHATLDATINKMVAAGVLVVYCHIGGRGYRPSNRKVQYASVNSPAQFAPVVGGAMVKALAEHKADV